ncbi:MAG TPA: excisionase family DNA-binding protein [Candidatus Dormibacteraeota bacterium]|nr:excisionase family DNA-binding protein [Candidatus Dormibacteraeota bacterium]
MAIASPPPLMSSASAENPYSSGNLIAPPSIDEIRFAEILAEALANPRHFVGLNIDGSAVAMPQSLHAAVRRLCQHLAAGRAVTLTPHRTTLTPRQAAELLGVSRPHVMKLLHLGDLHSSKVGAHHRLALEEVLRYRAQRDAEFEAAMDEFAEETEAVENHQ